MLLFRSSGSLSRLATHDSFRIDSRLYCPLPWTLSIRYQTRYQHNRPRKQQLLRPARANESEKIPELEETVRVVDFNDLKERAFLAENPNANQSLSRLPIYYLRPAIWALLVSGGIFTGLAFLEATQDLKPKKSKSWLDTMQPGTQTRGPPTPTQVATQWWEQLNPISKVSCGIIATNSVIHLSSSVVPRYWNLLWHMPARNVNYTLFTSMFVHSGPLHLFVNMYCTNNFMIPVGYSNLFEGNPYHMLSFFLSTGVLSGFAQHWVTLPWPRTRGVPNAFVRCGGASGALLGVLGVFCMQYPQAGLGIMFIPVHFDAQYVLPVILAFDLIGMVRGYSFLNLGHAVSLKTNLSNLLIDHL